MFGTKRTFLFSVLFLVATVFAHALDKGDYYYKDSIRYINVNLVNLNVRENCRFCREKTNDSIICWSPKQIREYRVDFDQYYESIDIGNEKHPKQVFLKRIQIGDLLLYRYAGVSYDRFFLKEPGKPMVELMNEAASGQDFRKQLAEWTNDCPVVSSQSSWVEFTEQSLTGFLESYKARRLKFLPKMRYGFKAGLNISQLETLPENADPSLLLEDFHPSDKFGCGFFLAQPLFVNGLSINVQANYSLYVLKADKTIVQGTINQYLASVYHLSIILQQLDVPIYLRYTCPKGRIRPFVEAGGLLEWNVVNEENINWKVIYGTKTTNFGTSRPRLIDAYNVGTSLGFGIECPVRNKQNIFLECQLAHVQGLAHPDYSKMSKMTFSAGYTF